MPERQPRAIRVRGVERAKDPALAGSYQADVVCLNCDWEGEVDVPKGTAAPRGQRLGNVARCECCGCHTLQRREEPVEAAREPLPNGESVDEGILRRLIEAEEEAERRRWNPTPYKFPNSWITSAGATAPRSENNWSITSTPIRPVSSVTYQPSV